MAQNDPIYQPGDRVLVYANASLAAINQDGKPAQIVREHPNEPGTLELAYDDGDAAYVPEVDYGRLRRESDVAGSPATEPGPEPAEAEPQE